MQTYFKGFLKNCKMDEHYFLSVIDVVLTENILHPLKV